MELRFSRTRLVQIGVMAAPVLSLSAEVLRSSGLEIVGSGTGNAPPPRCWPGNSAGCWTCWPTAGCV